MPALSLPPPPPLHPFPPSSSGSNSTASDPSVPPGDPNASQCHLLGPTALIVQAVMGVVVIASLLVKRQLERRKRRWRVWMGDVGKQLVGQGMVHLLNLLISDVVARVGDGDRNPCSLYFLNILIDTTLGVIILFVALKAFNWLFVTRLALEGYASGNYGDPPRMSYWWKQLVPYLLAIASMKLLVVLPLTLPRISATLIRASQSMLAYLAPNVQVIFVLAVFPLIMNVFQFCVIDQIVKAGVGGKGGKSEVDEEEGEGSDDEVEDGEGGSGESGGKGKGYKRLPMEGDEERERFASPPRSPQLDRVPRTSHGDLRRRNSARDLTAAMTPNIAAGSFEYPRSASPDGERPTSPLLPQTSTGLTVPSATSAVVKAEGTGLAE